MIKFFQRLTKLYEPVGRVQFVSLKKFTSAYLFQIAQEKSCEYILEINMNILKVKCDHRSKFSNLRNWKEEA